MLHVVVKKSDRMKHGMKERDKALQKSKVATMKKPENKTEKCENDLQDKN